jgi:hypothetical protein
LALVCAGIANADDQLVGQTFKDAKGAIGQLGLSPVVATTVGDRKDWGDCVVTSENKAPFSTSLATRGAIRCWST